MTDKYVMPMFCACCGAYLQGGATVHQEDCEIRKLIEESFPNANQRRSSDQQ